ncbi:hypothetical protein [Pseudomonas syringae]|uniref:hypothetical protein n=1 Tax=Pseudomonas syringae TaxID=317 RepID=UPI001F0EDF70|nr:hypothetical protein [Pseudomonas syringae]MCH5518696.1 hypothetical protein [Pseudomonas syringae pv. lapsa]
MIYSRLLYTEHEQPHNDEGEGAYTIFSTQQLFGADCAPLGDMSAQKFAVLWEGQPDTRVIDLIEQAIVLTILSPVKLLNASKGTLVVVHDSKLVGENNKLFCLAWEKLAAGVMYDEWTVLFVKDTGAGPGLEGGRIFRQFAREILDNNELGIVEFTPDMFLFKDDWAPENIFGPPPGEEPEAEPQRTQHAPGLFDEDADSWRESTTGSKPVL